MPCRVEATCLRPPNWLAHRRPAHSFALADFLRSLAAGWHHGAHRMHGHSSIGRLDPHTAEAVRGSMLAGAYGLLATVSVLPPGERACTRRSYIDCPNAGGTMNLPALVALMRYTNSRTSGVAVP